MKLFTISQVAETHLSKKALEEALDAAENALYDQGITIHFRSIVEGYNGQFAEVGADPDMWDVHTPKHGTAAGCACAICEKLSDGQTCGSVFYDKGDNERLGSCAGWYVDTTGKLNVCRKCGLYADAAEVAKVIEVLRDIGHEMPEAMGWAVFEAGPGHYVIQKDDERSVFGNDDEAIGMALSFLGEATDSWIGPRFMTRYETSEEAATKAAEDKAAKEKADAHKTATAATP